MRSAFAVVGILLPAAEPALALTVDSEIRMTSVAATIVEAGTTYADQAFEAGVAGQGFGSTITATALPPVDHIAEAHATQLATITQASSLLTVRAGGGVLSYYDLVSAGPTTTADASADSSLQLVFTLDSPGDYMLAGVIEVCLEQRTAVSGSAAAQIRGFFSLVGAASGVIHDAQVLDDVPIFDEVSMDLLYSGTLVPDTYTLDIGTTVFVNGSDDSFASGIAAWGIDLSLAVPEPSTGLLVGVALLVLVSGRHAPGRLRRA